MKSHEYELITVKTFSTIVTAVVYPIGAHWGWGYEGWLKQRGFSDFAGSGVVHVVGGVHALIGNMLPLICAYDNHNVFLIMICNPTCIFLLTTILKFQEQLFWDLESTDFEMTKANI